MTVTMRDLRETDAAGWVLNKVEEFQRDCDVVFLWFGPPSGTASRAREAPLPQARVAPRPLRSREFPAGLPELPAEDAARVADANVLYDFIARVVHALPPGVQWAIENPASSYLWELPAFKGMLLVHPRAVDVVLTSCNYGGSRPKRIRLRTNVAALGRLGGPCTGAHPPRYLGALHAPWGAARVGGFALASEAEYPP